MTFLSSHSAKSWFFTIYMGKPVGSRFGQMVRTIQDRQISSWNRVYHFYNYKSVPIIEKRPRKPETGIKDGFEEMEHEFSSVWSIPTANLPDETTQKIVFHLQFPTEFTEHFFVNFEQPTSLTVAVETAWRGEKWAHGALTVETFSVVRYSTVSLIVYRPSCQMQSNRFSAE